MTVLTIIPKTDCDADGIPLDWLRCRKCDGLGKRLLDFATGTGLTLCPTCAGHRSLHAAAMINLRYRQWNGAGGMEGTDTTLAEHIVRCEDCQHPMSEGTWEGGEVTSLVRDSLDEVAATLTRSHLTVQLRGKGTYHSRCDDLCNHGGPGRSRNKGGGWTFGTFRAPQMDGGGGYEEASWRPVNISFVNGWANDLRQENLHLLCLRCEADNA